MSEGILPMSKSEVKKLDDAMNLLRHEYKSFMGTYNVSGEFAVVSIMNFDNEIIFLEMKYGAEGLGHNLSFVEKIKMDRKNMQVIKEKSEVQ